MDPKIIKKTQNTLGKIITKPPLTDKLLGKPPFRFLHDITTSVIKTTGFMNGLFTDTELNSENVKEKESKIAFLQKSIDMVCLVTGKSLAVRPQKIVAGHEPEKTNEFLQVLAEAIKMKVNNEEYVKKLLNKGKGGTEEKESRSRSADRRKRDPEEKRDKEKGKDVKEKSHDREKSHEKSKDREKSRDKDREKSRDRDRDHRRKKSEATIKDQNEAGGSLSDQESQAEDTPVKSPSRVKSKKKHSKTREDESPSTDEKQTEAVKQGFKNPRPKADRPRGTRRKSERSLQIVRPGDESSDDDSEKARKPSDDVDKKRKTGTKSRLGVRHEQKSDPGEVKEDESKKVVAKNDVENEIMASSHLSKPKPTSSISNENNEDSSKHRSPKSSSTPKTEKTSRRKSVDSKMNDPKGHQQSAQVAPARRRKSSFTLLPDAVDKMQREESGKENESPDREKMVNGEESNKETHTRLQRPTSAKGTRRRREEIRHNSHREDEEFVQKQEPSVGEADLPPQVANARRMARPSSARPAPPRPKQDGAESEPAMRLGTGRPANVIVDNGQQSDDDDDNFIVEESAPPPTEPDQLVVKQEAEDDAEHGALVKKMLETKKEFEEGSQQQQQQTGPPKKTEIERPTMSDAARRKQREVVQKEIDKLRNSIQSLTRSANPLGKIMDYVQEDLDSMQKELEKWKAENKDHSQALKREKGITDRSVEPLKAQLADLDQAIKDQLDLIAATKSNIIRNDQKIDRVLNSVAKS